ncbi:hypothetical protein P5V15_007177 [Pogonomyrmex californicus]
MMLRSPQREGGKEEMIGMLRKMTDEIKEGLRGIRQEINKIAEEQKEVMRIEMEKIKNELKIREEKWRKKKEEMKERIERIEKKLKRMKIESKVEGDGKRIRKSAEVVEGKRNMEINEWKERVRKLERRWETKEREDRRRNILIRGLKEREGEKKIIEKLLWKIEGEVEMKEIRKIERGRREKGDMVIVKMRNELKVGETWIEENLIWEERRIKWKIRQAALRERGEIWVDEIWWRWDNDKEELRDDRGTETVGMRRRK